MIGDAAALSQQLIRARELAQHYRAALRMIVRLDSTDEASGDHAQLIIESKLFEEALEIARLALDETEWDAG